MKWLGVELFPTCFSKYLSVSYLASHRPFLRRAPLKWGSASPQPHLSCTVKFIPIMDFVLCASRSMGSTERKQGRELGSRKVKTMHLSE